MDCISRVTEDLLFLGVNDRKLSLFESAYPVPRGISYNSYLLRDEKKVLFDTVDAAFWEPFYENLEAALAGDALDVIVVHHMEPDHSACLIRLLERYPEAELVATQKTVQMISNFFSVTPKNVHVVKEGDTMSVGKHSIRFLMAPMVHWPEVMMSYLPDLGVLFSADAFGTFGALGGSIFADESAFARDYLDEARRYYFNIVGKYGVQVQSVLKKAAGLKISCLCPLHGPVWRKDIGWFLDKYDFWSRYLPEERGVVVFYASVYGHTQNAAEILARRLAEQAIPVKIYDVSHTHVSILLAEAFRYSHLVFCAATYNNGIFVSMENFLADLRAHFMQKRKYALVECGSWAPQAGGLMEKELAAMKDMEKLGETVTVLSSVREESRAALGKLIDAIAGEFLGNE